MMNRLLGRGLAAAALLTQLVLGAGEAAADPLQMRVEAVSVWGPESNPYTVVIAGQSMVSTSPLRLMVAQFEADGRPATWFGQGGWLEYVAFPEPTTFKATAVAKYDDGRVLVAATMDGVPALIRFNSNGVPDYSFGGRNSGMSWDTQSIGLKVRALTIRSDGTIVAIGSYSGPDTQERPVAAIYQYDSYGYLMPQPFGIRTHDFGTGGSELRAVHVNPTDGSMHAAGYASNAGEKDFLVTRILSNGDLDPSFGSGGKTIINVFSGRDDEAFAITRDSWGRIIAAGRDGHTFADAPQSNFAIVRLDAGGYPDWSFGYAGARTVNFWNTPLVADATATSVHAMPNTNDIVVSGTAVDRFTGRAYFALYRQDVDPTDAQGSWGPIVSPMTDGDDLMTASYAPWNYIVAIGTRESLQGVNALRVRYFADTGEFDTDFSEGDNDTTPNPFAFEPYGITVGPAFEAASGRVRIGGLGQPAPISVTGGEYQIDCTYTGAWLTAPGYLYNGQTVCVRTVSATTPDTTSSVTLTVGTRAASFSLTTSNVPNTTIDATPPPSSGPAVTFRYSWERATGTPTGYECRLDGAQWAVCGPAGITYSGLAMGPHAFEVRAANEWGVDATPASHAWSVATISGTTITSAPAANTNQTPATFQFTADDPLATFQCKLDNGNFVWCTSPWQYAPLAQGTHTFQVRAVNGAGTDATPASWTWNYDTQPPDIGFTTGPAAQSNSATATFGFYSSEPTQFECSLDSGAFAACSNPVIYAGLADGFHHFEFRGRDLAGNLRVSPYATHNWFIDATAPDTVFLSTPPASMTSGPATFSFVPSGEPGTLECSLDGAAFAACASPVTLDNLALGSHTFQVRARDALGNADATPASYTWTIETIPETTLTRAPSGLVASTDATFEFSANVPATFECSLDGAGWYQCSSPTMYIHFTQGAHTFSVRATRGPGLTDLSPATATWTVDTQPPTTFILSAPSEYTSSRTATFTFGTSSAGAVEPGATFECRLDGAAGYSPCANPQSYSGLADGVHVLAVRAVDAAGNRDPFFRIHPWEVDGTAPDTLITSGPDVESASSSATFTFEAGEAGVTFQCRLDGSAFVACTSPASYAGLGNGPHLLEVRSIDRVGNTDLTPYAYPWTVNAGAPNTVFTRVPDVTTEATTATFEFSADMPATFECRIDGIEWFACESPGTLGGLSLGAHRFEVRARDELGNLEPVPAEYDWTVVDAPDTTIISGPSAFTADSFALFRFSADQPGSTFECRVDAAAFVPCSSPRAFYVSPGSHTFTVRARGPNGTPEVQPATWTWTLDTTRPDTTITSGPSGSNNPGNVTFRFSSNESAAGFECKMDGVAWSTCASPKSYSGLTKTTHTFQVRAIDAAGNVDLSPATRSFGVK